MKPVSSSPSCASTPLGHTLDAVEITTQQSVIGREMLIRPRVKTVLRTLEKKEYDKNNLSKSRMAHLVLIFIFSLLLLTQETKNTRFKSN
eukprot:410231-Amphidinium_carterae.1